MVKKIFIILFLMTAQMAFALAPEVIQAIKDDRPYKINSRGQMVTTNEEGKRVVYQLDFRDYYERNQYMSEKYVCIKNKRSEYYGYLYTLYTPVGKTVSYNRKYQQNMNGYSMDPIPCDKETPYFESIDEARHYYYPQWY